MRTPLQILFLILVTDLPPSIALGMEPGREEQEINGVCNGDSWGFKEDLCERGFAQKPPYYGRECFWNCLVLTTYCSGLETRGLIHMPLPRLASWHKHENPIMLCLLGLA